MFTPADLQTLRKARPFLPFRIVLSDGGTVEIRCPELVLVGRHCAVVGLLPPEATDTLIDRWTTVWYMHVARIEHLTPPGPMGSPTPSSV